MNKKILLADNSPTIQRVVELTFSTQGYEVTCIGNARDVLSRARSVRPDVVLLDVALPGESGYDLCRRLRQESEFTRTPVMLLTGTFEPFDRARARDAGAADHLTKPFESQVLIERVNELIRNPMLPSRILEPRVQAAVIEPPPPPRPEPPAPQPAPPRPSAPEPAAAPRPEQPTAEMMERIIQQVVERLSDDVVREVAWEVVPELAERLVRQRIRQIEEEAG